jgi:hypothetical protein
MLVSPIRDTVPSHLIRVCSFQPSVTTRRRVSSTKLPRLMNREVALLQADLGLVRNTLPPMDPGLVCPQVMAGLQEDFVRRSSLRRSVTLK